MSPPATAPSRSRRFVGSVARLLLGAAVLAGVLLWLAPDWTELLLEVAALAETTRRDSEVWYRRAVQSARGSPMDRDPRILEARERLGKQGG